MCLLCCIILYKGLSMSELGIKIKLRILAVGVGLIVFLSSITIAGFQIKNGLTHSAEKKIDEITELGYNVVNGYYQRAQAGEMSEATAKEMAIKDLKNFRYQG